MQSKPGTHCNTIKEVLRDYWGVMLKGHKSQLKGALIWSNLGQTEYHKT